MAEDSVEELKNKIAELEEEIARLRDIQPPDEYELDVQHLNENEVKVLQLVSLGMNNTEAAKAAGLHEDYIKDRMRRSLYFAKAYKDVREQFDQWQLSRIKFVLPRVWAEIDKLLAVDPESYLGDDPKYASVLLQQKVRILDKLLRLSYSEETKVIHEQKISEPALQLAEKNIQLLAEYMARLNREMASGSISNRLPENQIIDVTPVEIGPEFAEQPRDAEGRFLCLVCDKWVDDLVEHLKEHDMTLQRYKIEFDLDPMGNYEKARP